MEKKNVEKSIDIDNNYKLYLSREGNLEVFYTIKNNLKSYSTTVFVQ